LWDFTTTYTDFSGQEFTDTVTVKVDTLFDDANLLEGYQTQIFTPICEEDKCYSVRILFRWDAIGRYVSYDTIPGEPLTKLDHIPFTPIDYQKLHWILSNPNSVLGSYEKEELVRETRESEIDGFTGATIKEVKENVIEGGVYSCYTLWHLAHGEISTQLQERTAAMFSASLVKKMVEEKDQSINYFLIENFRDEDFSNYIEILLPVMERDEGYFTKNALEQCPCEALIKPNVQQFFALRFESLNYYSQVAFLEKLQDSRLLPELLKALKKSTTQGSSYRDELIGKILANND
jgi:hypothetical protein